MERMTKIGKAAKDIFAPTAAPPPRAPGKPPAAARPGRPATHDEPWTKVTVVLFDRQIVYLDRLAADMRSKTGTAIKRAEIIRALIDALAAAKIDLTAATSEGDLRAKLATALG